MIKTASETIREIFPGADLQQIRSNLGLARREEMCRNYPVASTCFLTLSFAKDLGPVITFRHRIKDHFGIDELSFVQYMGLIHPQWAGFYQKLAEVAYTTSIEIPSWAVTPEASYSICIPLKRYDGQYYWYQQLSFPALLDPKSGMLTAHLNCYHEIGPYEHHRPKPPAVHARYSSAQELQQLQLHFKKKLAQLSGVLTNFLSPKHQEIVEVYRDCLGQGEGQLPSLHELHALLPSAKSMEAVKRLRTRLNEALRDEFGENSHLANPKVFALMLNDFFPKSLRDKTGLKRF